VFDPGKIGNHDFLLVDVKGNVRIAVEEHVTAANEVFDLPSELGTCWHDTTAFLWHCGAVEQLREAAGQCALEGERYATPKL
jgi:hypothetical protein